MPPNLFIVTLLATINTTNTVILRYFSRYIYKIIFIIKIIQVVENFAKTKAYEKKIKITHPMIIPP